MSGQRLEESVFGRDTGIVLVVVDELPCTVAVQNRIVYAFG